MFIDLIGIIIRKYYFFLLNIDFKTEMKISKINNLRII